MQRRQILKAASAGAALCALPAIAQQWPSKVITWVYPYASGGGADPLARSLAAIVGPRLGQQIVVDNRTGASGMIGATAVARAPADGHTFLFCVSSEVVVNQWLFQNMTYDPEKDLVPVSRLTTLPFALVASKQSNLGSVADLVAAAKARAGKLTFGSPGSGTLQHIAGELLQRTAGVQFTHVPYRGIAAVTNDLLAGHVDTGFVGLSTAAPLAGVPEMAPLGRLDAFKGFDVMQWFGLMAPRGTPQPVIDRMAKELDEVMKMPQVAQQLESQGLTSALLAPADFGAFIAREREKYGKVVREAKITAT